MFLIVFLIVLIVVRLLENQSEWIQIINYICILIAFMDLYIKLKNKYKSYKSFKYYTTGFILFLIPLIVFAALIFTKKIETTSKSSDIMTIIVLLVSLPSDLYCNITNNILKKGDRKYEKRL